MSERVSDELLAAWIGPWKHDETADTPIIQSICAELIARRAAERDAVPVAWGVQSESGMWMAIWHTEYAANSSLLPNPPEYQGRKVIPLCALPAAPEK